jgi:ribonucleoside-diphosphate reductase beta chain
MWFKNDFSYKKDGEDYAAMEKPLQVLFLKNLKFQTLADSVAARSVAEVFLPITTNPQLEVWWLQHAFFEGVVHSPTYAEILKALPVDAKEIFDDIIVNPEITQRAQDIVKCFDDTILWNARRITKDPQYDLFEHQKSLVLSLYALNILEAVLFKSSFVTTFAYAENGVMESSAKAVKKIQLDEIGHYQMSTYLLKRHKELPDWAPAFAAVEEEAVAMYRKTMEIDYLWVNYSFPEGESINLLGLNNSILKQYIDYNIFNVMQNVQLPSIVKRTKNPCTWVDKYAKLSNTQVAMKETDSSNYLLGKLDTYVSNEVYETLKF